MLALGLVLLEDHRVGRAAALVERVEPLAEAHHVLGRLEPQREPHPVHAVGVAQPAHRARHQAGVVLTPADQQPAAVGPQVATVTSNHPVASPPATNR